MSLRKYVEHFAQHTSMHGFGKVIFTKRPEKRAAWAIVFVSAWALFTYELINVLTKYFEYSKKTTSEFVSGGAPFPAITLCNMQSIDFYAMHKYIKAVEGYKQNSYKSILDLAGISSFAYHSALLYNLQLKYSKHQNISLSENSEILKIFSRTTFAANLPEDILNEIAVNQEEFIVKCTYRNSNCTFTTIRDPYFLKCFTFEPPNMKNMSFEDFQSLREGIANGLSVTLFTGPMVIDNNFGQGGLPGVYDRNSPLSGSSGIRVVIHPPGTEPFPLIEGYDVPPGYQASLGIIPERRKRLGRPYGFCDSRNRYKRDYLKEPSGDEYGESELYRKISCELMCMQRQVIKECKCIDEFLPVLGNTRCNEDTCWLLDKNDTRDSDFHKRRVQSCRRIASLEECALEDSCNASMVADTLKNIRCADEVINRLMTDLEALSKCNCYAPCDEFRYYVSYSLAKWPSGYESSLVVYDILRTENFFDRFTEGKREVYEEHANRTGEQRMNDFAKINIYVTDSNVLKISEEPEITITQLISDVGGQLGLWVGVSVITISEVIETMLEIVTAGFRQFWLRLKAEKPTV